MVTYIPDWRWLLDRNDSPWYPTARLFRQAAVDDWGVVIARVHDALRGFNLCIVSKTRSAVMTSI